MTDRITSECTQRDVGFKVKMNDTSKENTPHTSELQRQIDIDQKLKKMVNDEWLLNFLKDKGYEHLNLQKDFVGNKDMFNTGVGGYSTEVSFMYDGKIAIRLNNYSRADQSSGDFPGASYYYKLKSKEGILMRRDPKIDQGENGKSNCVFYINL